MARHKPFGRVRHGNRCRRQHAPLSFAADCFATSTRRSHFRFVAGGETVTVAGKTFELGTAQYPGMVQPKGYLLLDEFRTEPFPSWRFNLDGTIVQKTLCLLEKEQSVLVCYQASQACQMRVRPMLSMRDYHSLMHQNSGVSGVSRFAGGRCSFNPYADRPSLTILHSAQTFQPDVQWYLNNEYHCTSAEMFEQNAVVTKGNGVRREAAAPAGKARDSGRLLWCIRNGNRMVLWSRGPYAAIWQACEPEQTRTLCSFSSRQSVF